MLFLGTLHPPLGALFSGRAVRSKFVVLFSAHDFNSGKSIVCDDLWHRKQNCQYPFASAQDGHPSQCAMPPAWNTTWRHRGGPLTWWEVRRPTVGGLYFTRITTTPDWSWFMGTVQMILCSPSRNSKQSSSRGFRNIQEFLIYYSDHGQARDLALQPWGSALV